jgi:L-iditol 2-dehydrogenase
MGFEVVDYHQGEVVEQVRARTQGLGAHVAIDTGGTAESVLSAVNVLRKGGRASFTGIPDTPVSLPMQKIVLEEIDLYGVRANPNTMEEVIPLIVTGRVRVKELMTHTFPLDDYGQALHTFANRIDGALKVIVKPNL